MLSAKWDVYIMKETLKSERSCWADILSKSTGWQGKKNSGRPTIQAEEVIGKDKLSMAV